MISNKQEAILLEAIGIYWQGLVLRESIICVPCCCILAAAYSRRVWSKECGDFLLSFLMVIVADVWKQILISDPRRRVGRYFDKQEDEIEILAFWHGLNTPFLLKRGHVIRTRLHVGVQNGGRGNSFW